MKNIVIEYFTQELHETQKRAEEMYKKLEKYPDILEEFLFWIKNNDFKKENPIEIEGYTALKLMQSTYLEPIGAYNYLIYLKEKPEEALEYLKKGLPKK